MRFAGVRLPPLDPGHYWDIAGERIARTRPGGYAVRYGRYAALPLLAVFAGLAPGLLDTRWTFIVIVAATFLIMRSRGIFGVVVISAMLAYLPIEMDPFERNIMYNVALYTLLGIGLNVVVGFAGLLDLGYVAFFATGAYIYALLVAPEFGGGFDTGASFWLILPMALLLTALVGVALGVPVLRLRGDYLAIVTLGFGEIIRLMIKNEEGITNGPPGVYALPTPHLLDRQLDTGFEFYYVLLVGCLLAAFAAERILDSRVGRAWEAIREDEDVAAAMGVNTTNYKLLAFGIGAAIGGVGGVIYAAKAGSVFPDDLNLEISINVLALVIIAGMGNTRAIILGAFLLIGLPDVLRDFSIDLVFIQLENIGADYRLVIFGAALVAVMVLRPEGLIPSRRRAAEFEGAQIIEAQAAT